MPKSDPRIELDDYTPVADRIELFYSRFPTGRITTKLLPANDSEVVVKAFVYRQSEDTLPAATGLASERFGDGEVNMHSCLENTETSAIGRALANLGFAASRRRPSREEMDKVARVRSRLMVAERRPVAASSTSAPANEDLLHLLALSERKGLSRERVNILRQRASQDPGLSVVRIRKIESTLRAWLRRKAL
jgi:hypothetical protein